MTGGVQGVNSGERLSIDRYKNLLQGIERLKDNSEEVKAVYADTSVTLPKSSEIKSGYPVSANEFQKIRRILTAAEQERLHGEVEDAGYFVLVKPETKIPGKGNEGVFVANRTVKLSDYYIGKYEVTYKLWKEVCDWNVNNSKGYSFRAGRKGSHGDYRNTENDPVTEVSWYDCIVWCNAYTEKEKGIEQCVYVYSDTNQVIKSMNNLNPSKVKYDQSKKGYRLPTDAEWEYAARFQGKDSTNSTKYGHDYLLNANQLSGGCWYWDNANRKTHPVGEKSPNYAGLYDMSGNVWEWIYDGWESPSTGTHTNPIGCASADDRVMRGGSWGSGWGGCVVGYRDYGDAWYVSYWWYGYGGGYGLGWRLACSQ